MTALHIQLDHPSAHQLKQVMRRYLSALDLDRAIETTSHSCHHCASLINTIKIKTGKITRGHDFTLVKGQNRLDFRKYCFSQRTVNEWNKLSADCVHSSSVNMFKNRIDNYLVRAGYT